METRKPADSRTDILGLLCAAPRTAAELAAGLGISAQAVRKALAGLEAEGLVEYERVRREARKPVHEYRITHHGEAWLSQAYLPLLQRLLEAEEARNPAGTVEALLREAGRRLAPGGERPRGDPAARAQAAAAMLRGVGGITSAVQADGHVEIRCTCCAIGAVVAQHPLACKAMESMLAEYLGLSVRERCERGERPRCRFVLAE